MKVQAWPPVFSEDDAQEQIDVLVGRSLGLNPEHVETLYRQMPSRQLIILGFRRFKDQNPEGTFAQFVASVLRTPERKVVDVAA
jgi:hypothetical protein